MAKRTLDVLKPFFAQIWVSIALAGAALFGLITLLSGFHGQFEFLRWLAENWRAIAQSPFFSVGVAAILLLMMGRGVKKALQAQEEANAATLAHQIAADKEVREREKLAKRFADSHYRQALQALTDERKQAHRRLAEEAVRLRKMVREAVKQLQLDAHIREVEQQLLNLDRQHQERTKSLLQLGAAHPMPSFGCAERETMERIFRVLDHYPGVQEAHRELTQAPTHLQIANADFSAFPALSDSQKSTVGDWLLRYQRGRAYAENRLADLRKRREQFDKEFGRPGY